MPTTRCPAAPAYPADPTPPIPETLAYSLTLPAALASAALARATTREVLRAHGLTDMLDPALQAVGELTAVASQFTESSNYYLTLR
ncbi:ATP-binding protein, partial [Streptomyces violaceoruber]